MPSLFFYFIKLSVSLAAVYLFYQLVLRRLTFYNWNRWYLFIYTAIALGIPFINITPVLERNEWTDNAIIGWVPAINENAPLQMVKNNKPSFDLSGWEVIMLIVAFGTIVLLLRLIVQLISFHRMKRKAMCFAENGVSIYQVNDNIIPFSFGNSIFINRQLHSEEELQEIIRHEFIHVKQKHSIDILWAELLCLFNWYNPFAWLLKRAIRQNLEFIADNKVVENGISKKEYQYLLLKVIGDNQYSIATQFNFSSLKKRIAMMNKTKSTKRQLGRFLFLVPVLAIILLSFRQTLQQSIPLKTSGNIILADTIPDMTVLNSKADLAVLNSKGYYVDIKDDNGNCTVVVRDKDKKEVKRLLLTEWNAKADYYEDLYGEIRTSVLEAVKVIKEKNPDIRTFTVKGDKVTITLKNGKEETYTLSLFQDKKAFEERCGIKEVAIAPAETVIEVRPEPAITLTTPVEERIATVAVEPANTKLGKIRSDFEITEDKAIMHLKNGKTEQYNLKNPKERAAFEKKFGTIISPTLSVTSIGKPVKVITEFSESVEPVLSTVSVSPSKQLTAIETENEATIAEEEILFTITKKTTTEELESLVKKMKEKGYELKFTNKDYNDGTLTQISGTMKYKDSNSSFSATDFSRVIISTYRDGDNIRFRVVIGTKKGIS